MAKIKGNIFNNSDAIKSGIHQTTPLQKTQPLLSVTNLAVAFKQTHSHTADASIEQSIEKSIDNSIDSNNNSSSNRNTNNKHRDTLTLPTEHIHEHCVVKGISFDIYPGEIVALVGESGSGKSVTAHSILQLLPYPNAYHPTGDIQLFPSDTESENASTKKPIDLLHAPHATLQQVRGKRISMIFQEPMMALNPLHTLLKQIGEVIALHDPLITPSVLRKKVIELLEETGIQDPVSRLHHYPNQLSGGQRQRVMIAMALANRPDILIADEPTTALDVTIQQQILELLQNLQRRYQLSILLITHDFNVVKKIANRCLLMQAGHIVDSLTTQTLFIRAKNSGTHDHNIHRLHPYTKQLLEAEPEGSPSTQPDQEQTPLLIAKSISVAFPIHKGFFKKVVDHFVAVDNISIKLWAGETLGIVGESGSGKSTLVLALLQLIQFQGTVTFQQHRLNELKAKQINALRQQIQVVFQDPFGSLSPRLTIEDIIAEGLLVHAPHHSKEARRLLVCETLQAVGLQPEYRHRFPHEFSGGQRQRIAIARALILRPKLIILDEPTSALDRSVQKEVLDLLRQLQAQYQLSYIFISHDLKVVKVMSHRVMVMKTGKVIESGNTEDIFHSPQTEYTQQLINAAF